MDFNEFKKFIPKGNERIIFVEEGKPVFVLLGFNDYQKNFNSGENQSSENEENEKANSDTAESGKQESNEEQPSLDDLPF